MVQLLLSKTAVTAYEILVILILLVILLRQRKQKKAVQERRNVSDAKMRNARLEEKLKNPNMISVQSRQSNPYDVQYVQNAEKGSTSQLQIAIEVYTETSVQRHLFDLDREITIGQANGNDLVLNDSAAPMDGCCVLAREHAVYVTNKNQDIPIQIKRGKKKMALRNQMVKLQNKDSLVIGCTDMVISIYRN